MAANQGGRTRRRLSTGERREQLLSVGARLFSESPYDEVWIEQVAEIAGVSRGLLYHYFPTKRDFFAAVVERESERMLRMTAAVPGVPVREQLAAGLDAFLEYVETHAHGFRAFHRADAAGDQACARSTGGRWPRRSGRSWRPRRRPRIRPACPRSAPSCGWPCAAGWRSPRPSVWSGCGERS